jgi:hypothetical protein
LEAQEAVVSIWSSVLSIAAPFVGAAIGGPAGFAVGTAIGSAIGPKPQAQQLIGGPPPVGPGAGVGGGMVKTGTSAAGKIIQGGMSMLGRWLIGARGIARNATGKIVGVMRGEQLFRNKRVIALAKQIGMAGAATALGITLAEVAEMFVAESGKRRRTRGISGRDIKCTRRTLGKIRSVQRMIGVARPASRARGRPAVAVRCD